MNRHSIALALLAMSAPISAASAASYSAVPASPSTDARIIGRDLVWRCGPDSCAGATEYGRPLVLCQGLAKRTGRLKNFIVDGRALSPAELDVCNRVARGGSPDVLAKAD